jgi:hypothetical protein
MAGMVAGCGQRSLLFGVKRLIPKGTAYKKQISNWWRDEKFAGERIVPIYCGHVQTLIPRVGSAINEFSTNWWRDEKFAG